MAVWEHAQRGIVLGTVLASACFSRPPGPSGSHDDASLHSDSMTDHDAALTDGRDLGSDAPGACLVHDDFSGSGAACGAWGGQPVVTAGATAMRNNGQLVISSAAAGEATCTSLITTNPLDGVQVQIVGALTPSDTTTAELQFELDGGATTVIVSISGGRLDVTDGPDVESFGSWAESSQAYFKIIEEAGTGIRVYTGPDGANWNLLHTFAHAPSALPARVRLYASFPDSNPVIVRFDNLDACP